MDHWTSSEALNQTYSSNESIVSDVSQQTTCERRHRCSDTSPGSQPANPATIYVLKNCNRCPDYMVSACQENKCPRQSTNGKREFFCRSTKCTAECHSHSTKCSAEYPSKESLQTKKTIPPKAPAPQQKKGNKRRVGGSTASCTVCGQQKVHEPGQTMCPYCNERIHTAVNNYLQCQCQAKEEHHHPPNPSVNPNLNVIVLPDCHNQQEVIAQLSKLINVGQVTQALSKAPFYQGNCFYQQNTNNGQNNTNHYQDYPSNGVQEPITQPQPQLQPQPPFYQANSNYLNNTSNDQNNTNQYQDNTLNGGQVPKPPPPPGYQDNSNYVNNTNHYQNNPLPGYNDYDYDYQRGYEHPEGYDYRYDMGPGMGYSGNYGDDRYPRRAPCNSFNCPRRGSQPFEQDLYSEEYDCDYQDEDQDEGEDCACTCTCNCQFCRKGFETKEKLAMLLAQALEIFVNNQESKNKKPKKKDKNNNKNNYKNNNKNSNNNSNNNSNKNIRSTAGATCVKPEESKRSRPRRRYPGKPPNPSYLLRKRAPSAHMRVLSQAHGSIPLQAEKQINKTASKMTNCNANSNSNNGSKMQSSAETSVPSKPSNADCLQKNTDHPPFFLPNSEEQRSSQHSGSGSSTPHGHHSGKDSWSDSCSNCGGGDSRRRRRARRRGRHGKHCHWQDSCNACSNPGHNRTSAGDKNSQVLLGLSPIAHYRPGMMKFPVNYLLAGTNYRRSLVRTAAGVTLHQKPYLDKDEVMDLPCFPCRKKSSHLEVQTPPAKKWL